MTPWERLNECLRLLDLRDYYNGGQTVLLDKEDPNAT